MASCTPMSHSTTMTRVTSPHLSWTPSSMLTVTWSGIRSHSTTLARAVSHLHSTPASDSSNTTDLLLLCEGQTIPVHRLVVAAASPYLARLVREADSSSPLCLVGLSYSQAMLVVQFMYRGLLERLSEEEIERLLEATKHLQITGLNNGRTAIVKTEIDMDNAMEDDDVFADNDHHSDNEHAVDLSPVNRQAIFSLLSSSFSFLL